MTIAARRTHLFFSSHTRQKELSGTPFARVKSPSAPTSPTNQCPSLVCSDVTKSRAFPDDKNHINGQGFFGVKSVVLSFCCLSGSALSGRGLLTTSPWPLAATAAQGSFASSRARATTPAGASASSVCERVCLFVQPFANVEHHPSHGCRRIFACWTVRAVVPLSFILT